MKYMKWSKLITMAIVSFLVMYVLMYVMVNNYNNVYASLNQFYMAAMMTGAMMLVEIAVMASMYEKKVKIITTVISAVVLILFFVFIRSQFAITDKEFLKSMITHHGSALLMCENAKLKDPEIKTLCEGIISGQQEQIDWMKTKLKSL